MTLKGKGVALATQIVYSMNPSIDEMAEIVDELVKELRLCYDTGCEQRAARLRKYLRVIAHLADTQGVVLPNIVFKPVQKAIDTNA